MFHALRTAARRATFHKNEAFHSATNTTNASMAAAAFLLVALTVENQRDKEDSKNRQNAIQTDPSFPHFSPFKHLQTNTCQCELSSSSSSSNVHSNVMPDHDLRLQRAVTSRRMAAEAAQQTFFTLYEVDFDNPLGSGAYGDVYLCREISSGEGCALKKIPKEFTDQLEFQREMSALLHIRAQGGHPNVCMLRENFDDQDDYLLVLDLVSGKE